MVLHIHSEEIFMSHFLIDLQKIEVASQNRFRILINGSLHQSMGIRCHQLVFDKGQIHGLFAFPVVDFQNLMFVIGTLAQHVTIIQQGVQIGFEQL